MLGHYTMGPHVWYAFDVSHWGISFVVMIIADRRFPVKSLEGLISAFFTFLLGERLCVTLWCLLRRLLLGVAMTWV